MSDIFQYQDGSLSYLDHHSGNFYQNYRDPRQYHQAMGHGYYYRDQVHGYYSGSSYYHSYQGKGKGQGNGQGKGRGKGQVNGQGKGRGKGQVNGQGKGNGKGKGNFYYQNHSHQYYLDRNYNQNRWQDYGQNPEQHSGFGYERIYTQEYQLNQNREQNGYDSNQFQMQRQNDRDYFIENNFNEEDTLEDALEDTLEDILEENFQIDFVQQNNMESRTGFGNTIYCPFCKKDIGKVYIGKIGKDDDDDDRLYCGICMSHHKNAAIFDCRHAVCSKCFESLGGKNCERTNVRPDKIFGTIDKTMSQTSSLPSSPLTSQSSFVSYTNSASFDSPLDFPLHSNLDETQTQTRWTRSYVDVVTSNTVQALPLPDYSEESFPSLVSSSNSRSEHGRGTRRRTEHETRHGNGRGVRHGIERRNGQETTNALRVGPGQENTAITTHGQQVILIINGQEMLVTVHRRAGTR